MKKILDYTPVVAKKTFFICAILSAVMFTSCRRAARALIAVSVEALDSDCPKSLGDGVRCMQVFVEDNSVVFEIEVDEDESGRTIWSYDRREMYDKFSDDHETLEIRKLLRDAKYSMIFRVVGKYWGDQRDIIMFDWRQ